MVCNSDCRPPMGLMRASTAGISNRSTLGFACSSSAEYATHLRYREAVLAILMVFFHPRRRAAATRRRPGGSILFSR